MNGFDHIFKFKIGDEVRLKVHRPGYAANGAKFVPQICVVAERHMIECYGGVQLSYGLRIHSLQTTGTFSNDNGYNFLQGLIPVTEPELVPLEEMELSAERPEPKRRRGPSPLDEPPPEGGDEPSTAVDT
jgi:hypothetical protein